MEDKGDISENPPPVPNNPVPITPPVGQSDLPNEKKEVLMHNSHVVPEEFIDQETRQIKDWEKLLAEGQYGLGARIAQFVEDGKYVPDIEPAQTSSKPVKPAEPTPIPVIEEIPGEFTHELAGPEISSLEDDKRERYFLYVHRLRSEEKSKAEAEPVRSVHPADDPIQFTEGGKMTFKSVDGNTYLVSDVGKWPLEVLTEYNKNMFSSEAPVPVQPPAPEKTAEQKPPEEPVGIELTPEIANLALHQSSLKEEITSRFAKYVDEKGDLRIEEMPRDVQNKVIALLDGKQPQEAKPPAPEPVQPEYPGLVVPPPPEPEQEPEQEAVEPPTVPEEAVVTVAPPEFDKPLTPSQVDALDSETLERYRKWYPSQGNVNGGELEVSPEPGFAEPKESVLSRIKGLFNRGQKVEPQPQPTAPKDTYDMGGGKWFELPLGTKVTYDVLHQYMTDEKIKKFDKLNPGAMKE